jgi:hypothetical protein
MMKGTIGHKVASKTTATINLGISTAQIASDPKTNPQLLRKIATEPDGDLRRLVASNPNTPTDILWQLGIDFPEAILSNPIFELLQLEHLQLVAEIPHATLTSLLQCERVPKSFMEYAVDLQDYSLWLAVAYNSHTPGGLLENLALKSRSQDRELIRAVAAHPNTPARLLAQIIDISGSVAQIVAENVHTPINILEQILHKYAQTNDSTFTTLVALHPHLDPRLLIKMDLAPDESAARSLWQAKQPATDATELLELAKTDWDVLRLAVVRNPNTPTIAIERIWHQLQVDFTAHRPLNRLIYDSFASNLNTSPQLRGELHKLLKW